MITAQEWYRNFYRSYFRFPAIRRALNGRKVTDSEWTRIMKAQFLHALAKDLGYSIAEETFRVDQMWKSGEDLEVAIEHENWYSNIMNREVPNLSDVNAQLKVLITYVANGELNWRPYDLAQKVKQHLDKKKMQGEFLLLVSDENSEAWSTFKFAPKFVADMSVLSPPTPGLKSAETKRKKSPS